MSSFLSKKKNKEKYELNSVEGTDSKEKKKEYGSITSLVNNEVNKQQNRLIIVSLFVCDSKILQ